MLAQRCCDSSNCNDVQGEINMIEKTKAPNRCNSANLLKNLLRRYGSEAVEQAKKSILDEPFEDEVVSNALHYFMCDYWKDYATPTLLSLSHEAVRGTSKFLASVAPALILISGAVDIHDDIVDRSKRKDGRSTVYGKFGEEVALLVGDALLIKGSLMLALACQSIDRGKREKIMNVLKHGLFELGEAEMAELRFRGVTDVKPRDYLIVMKKKAADVEALMRIGAILGNAKKNEIEALGNYGRILGLISILRDDIIDMTLQEELRHRLEHECLPLPFLYALQQADPQVELLKFIRNGMKTNSDYARIRSLTGNGFKKTASYINELITEGKASTEDLRKRGQKLRFVLTRLADLTEYEISNPNGT